MQKWKIVLPIFLVCCSTFQVLSAEVSSPDNMSPTKSAELEAVPAPVQDHMLEMMQDDFSFQNQKRSLSNELELEKLRAEIQKAKGISKLVPVAEPVSSANEPAEASVPDESKIAEVIPLPKVLLVSDIGGVSRAAILSNDMVTLVKMNQKISLDGHNYIVSYTGKNMPTIREINK